MRSLAELTPAAAASSSEETVATPSSPSVQGAEVDREPGDGGLGDALAAVTPLPVAHRARATGARRVHVRAGHGTPSAGGRSHRPPARLGACEREHKVSDLDRRAAGQRFSGSAGEGGPEAVGGHPPEVVLLAVDQGHRDLLPVLLARAPGRRGCSAPRTSPPARRSPGRRPPGPRRRGGSPACRSGVTRGVASAVIRGPRPRGRAAGPWRPCRWPSAAAPATSVDDGRAA